MILFVTDQVRYHIRPKERERGFRDNRKFHRPTIRVTISGWSVVGPRIFRGGSTCRESVCPGLVADGLVPADGEVRKEETRYVVLRKDRDCYLRRLRRVFPKCLPRRIHEVETSTLVTTDGVRPGGSLPFLSRFQSSFGGQMEVLRLGVSDRILHSGDESGGRFRTDPRPFQTKGTSQYRVPSLQRLQGG